MEKPQTMYDQLSEAQKIAMLEDYELTIGVLQKLFTSFSMMRETLVKTMEDTAPSREEVENEQH